MAATPATPAIGARAPLTRNPTLKNAPIKQIDTSDPPDESMHQLSIAEAVTSGRPSVIAFATPAFCQSRTCGPVMDVVGFVQRDYGTRVNFVHVEPFKLSETGELQVSPNGMPTLSEAASSWRLPTEPWVFVIDAAGVIVARFSGPFALEELQYALSQVVG